MEKGTVYFFTGLAGAGKTTIGGSFYQRLKQEKPDAVLVDGDKSRQTTGDHDYSTEARRRGAYIQLKQCKQLADQGKDVVLCSISMYRDVREWNRNQKGLYSPGQKNVVGVDLPYDEPEAPDVVIQNDGEQTPDEIVNTLEKILLQKRPLEAVI